MRQSSLLSNVVTYNAQIKGLCMQGMSERADYLFSKMWEDGVEPNSAVYTSMVDGHLQKGNVDDAMKHMSKMHDLGFNLDVATYGRKLEGGIFESSANLWKPGFGWDEGEGRRVFGQDEGEVGVLSELREKMGGMRGKGMGRRG
ncbi:hypothetical protein CerSpe_208050 [Prunus speciosa]